MKKAIACILMICLTLLSLNSVPVNANASQNDEWLEYSLDEIGVKVYLPADYLAYTRGMKADDPVVLATGLTPAEIDQILAEGNLYLEASNDDFNSEILVTMVGSSISDFASMTDEGLLAMSDLWVPEFEAYGMKIFEKDIFSHDGVKYVRMRQLMSDAGVKYYRIQYYTTVNYQAINFVFISVQDEITETERAFMQSVVEKASFGNEISVSSISSFVQDPTGFSYRQLEDGTACITGYEGITGSLAIPSEIDGHPVTAVETIENRLIANLYIPETVTVIPDNPFNQMWGLKTITVSEDNPSFSSAEGILYSRDGKVLICYPSAHNGDIFTIPSQVTKIGPEAFYGASSLQRLILPEGLTEIGDAAFFSVGSVYSITIPSTVSVIGANPFYGMSSLEEILVAPGNMTFTVQQGALYNRTENILVAYPRMYTASSFAFRDGTLAIGDYAFWCNPNAMHIQFPSSLISIGDSAFSNCGKMTFSDLPLGLQTIGPAAFMSSPITKATIPASIVNMGRACFAAAGLTEIEFAYGVTEIAPVMFNDCDFTSIRLPESIKTIGEMAFVNCEELEKANIPSSVTEMGEGVFKNCPNVVVSVVEGSYGEMYCKDNGIPYQYYEPDVSSNGVLREYTLQMGPFTVQLDDSRYNILIPGMDANEPSVIRSGIDADMLDAYLNTGKYDLLMIDINEHVPATFKIAIRIKDNKYEGVDLRECTPSEAELALNTIYRGFETAGSSGKEIVMINDVPYLKFTWRSGMDLRYATIINGDMIYIFGERKDSAITDSDADLLLQVVESVKFDR